MLAMVLLARSWFYRKSGSGELVIALSLVLLGSPAFGNVWLTTLERQYDLRACNAAQASTVVVLGAGLDTRYPVDSPAERLSHVSWRRAMAAQALFRPDGVVVFSGGGRFKNNDRFTEASAMASLVAERATAVNGLRVIEESQSRTTLENARFTGALLSAEGTPLDIVLVTSASHMLRARAVFEKTGFTVCPHAVAPVAQPEIPWGAWLPQTSGLQKTAIALREWVAIAFYRWNGWS